MSALLLISIVCNLFSPLAFIERPQKYFNRTTKAPDFSKLSSILVRFLEPR